MRKTKKHMKQLNQIEKARLWKALALWRRVLRGRYHLDPAERMGALARHERMVKS